MNDPVLDFQALAAESVTAANAAIDAVHRQINESAGEFEERLAADLDRVAEDFERSMEQVATDIAPAQRRQES